MAKCQHYTTRMRIGGFPPCKQDAVIRYDYENRCAEHADPNVWALVKQIDYLIDHGGIPTRDGDTGKLLAVLEPK